MKFWAWALLALLGYYAQAEVRVFAPCADRYGALRVPDRSTHLLAVETPRMYLGFGSQGGLEAFDKETGSYVGWVGMTVILRGDRKMAHLPIYFEDARGRGLGTEAKYGAMRYAFEVEGVEGIYANVHEENLASRNLHIKLGFREVKREKNVLTYEITRPEFEVAKQAFAAEDAATFLPRGRGPVKLVPVTERVNKSAVLVDTLFTDFLIELERGMGNEPPLKAALPMHGEELQRFLRTYSESLEPKRRALLDRRDRALADASSQNARKQIDAEYYKKLASLEGPLAGALVRDYLTQPDFQKAIKAEVAEPWLARLETLEKQGLSDLAKDVVRLRLRDLLNQLKQSGLVQKVTRMKITVQKVPG